MSIVPWAFISCFFSTMSLFHSITDIPRAGEVIAINACVLVSTAIGQATPQENYLRFSKPYDIASSWTCFSSSYKTLRNDESNAPGWECIGTIFRAVGKMPRIPWSLCDVPSNRSIATFSTIPNHARACRSLVHTYRDMTISTGKHCFMVVLNGGALADLTCEYQSGQRNELLTRFWAALVSSTLVTVRWVPGLMPAESKSRFVGPWKNVEIANRSLRLSYCLL